MKVNARAIGILVATVLIGIVVVGTIQKITQRNTRVANIVVAPRDADMTIDGRAVDGVKERLAIGEHELRITFPNFQEVKQKIKVTEKGDNLWFIVMNPANDEGRKYLRDHPEVQGDREGVAANEVDKRAQAGAEKYPYLSKLPLEGQRFTVSYGDPIETKQSSPDEPYIALFVSVTEPRQKRNALKSIADELGVSPTGVEIVFQDFKNPFDRKTDGE